MMIETGNLTDAFISRRLLNLVLDEIDILATCQCGVIRTQSDVDERYKCRQKIKRNLIKALESSIAQEKVYQQESRKMIKRLNESEGKK